MLIKHCRLPKHQARAPRKQTRSQFMFIKVIRNPVRWFEAILIQSRVSRSGIVEYDDVQIAAAPGINAC